MEAHLALLQRLDEYSLDDPNSSFPFSAKLAKETGWSKTFTLRAIAEYKRFCYLAIVGGHPVAPSEVVDEVWHMHLIYSHEYWNNFCPNILGKPFHHFPSTGGSAEHEKFEDWFTKTLASYWQAFGEEPPKDIWMPEKAVLPREEHLTISKRSLKSCGQAAGLVAAVLLAAGCTGAAIGNPLDFRGPEFLSFYIWLFIILFYFGWTVRWLLRLPVQVDLNPANYPRPYEIAYLNGKGIVTVSAAVTNLLSQKAIEFDTKGQTLFALDPDSASNDPLESKILAATRSQIGVKMTMIRALCLPIIRDIHLDLQNKGLLVSPKYGTLGPLAGFFMALLAPLYGLLKIQVGISRERPVEYLTIMCVISFVMCLFLLVRPFRSRYGDRFLAAYRAQKSHLANVGRHRDAAPDDVILGLALFGAGAFVGSSLETQVKHLNPPSGSSSCSGGSSCSSGGGDGGEGGCGGGGGCGGCGG